MSAALPDEIIEKCKRVADQSRALDAAVAIAQMDPHSREDLACYMKELSEAQERGDQDHVTYLVGAIVEVFASRTNHDAPDLDAWQAEGEHTPEGKRASERYDQESRRFVARYQHFKARANFQTIQQVADAAGLSPTTVQAVEAQRVKPQMRTIQALAKAFGVDVSELLK